MNKPRRFLLVGVVGLAAGALAIWLLLPGESVSLRLLEYTRWPHGARLRLTNHGRAPVQYLFEGNGTPAGSPILRLCQTPGGWTNVSRHVQSVSAYNPTTGATSDMFIFFDDPHAVSHTVAGSRELKPGKSVDFWVEVEPGGPAIKIGTLCCPPESGFAKRVRPWLARIKRALAIKRSDLGAVEIWCPDPLHLDPLPTGSKN